MTSNHKSWNELAFWENKIPGWAVTVQRLGREFDSVNEFIEQFVTILRNFPSAELLFHNLFHNSQEYWHNVFPLFKLEVQ